MQRQTRIVIENVKPQLNSGTVFIKRVVNEVVHVTADVLVDGHDVLQADLLFKHENDKNLMIERVKKEITQRRSTLLLTQLIDR